METLLGFIFVENMVVRVKKIVIAHRLLGVCMG